jgi:hypothetical protein
MAEWYSHMCLHHVFFIHSSAGGHLHELVSISWLLGVALQWTCRCQWRPFHSPESMKWQPGDNSMNPHTYAHSTPHPSSSSVWLRASAQWKAIERNFRNKHYIHRVILLTTLKKVFGGDLLLAPSALPFITASHANQGHWHRCIEVGTLAFAFYLPLIWDHFKSLKCTPASDMGQ